MELENFEIINREISWLAFNDRVLQEAADPSVPLIERIRFLGIFSNNLDEFFRVRVAALKRMEHLGKEAIQYFEMDPDECLSVIQSTVIRLQAKFEKIYQSIITQLEEGGVKMLNEDELDDEQREFVRSYFFDKVRSNLVPIMLDKKNPFPQMKDKVIYLAIRLFKQGEEEADYALIELPTDVVSRFLVLPSGEDEEYVMLLDDVVRLNMPEIFSLFEYDQIDAYTIKITRDAELDFEEDVSKSFMEKMEDSVAKRKKGQFTRFVYDASMPDDLFSFLVKKLKLKESSNLIPGGRYHNFKNFISFPAVGQKKWVYEKWPALKSNDFEGQRTILGALRQKDVLLTYPYQSFDYVIDMLREAAIDPKVSAIRINVYRVAKDSKIINALINAARNGKLVEVNLELQARFDEKNNLRWSSILQEEGCKVLFGVQGLKVHSKLILIERQEEEGTVYYSHIGTGNFHEGNASLYTDFSLLTANQEIGKEVSNVFAFLKQNYLQYHYDHLLISPYSTRHKLIKLVKHEIHNAEKGKEAYIHIKLNNLVDKKMIQWLYKASMAGVQVKCVVRGICSIVPGVKGLSENIEVISIVDRFLEHTRLIIFANEGDEIHYISSADWMTRNLDRRVEVSAPIYDKKIKKSLRKMMDICLADNTKARIIDRNLYNLYVSDEGKEKVRAQHDTYEFFKKKLKELSEAEIEKK